MSDTVVIYGTNTLTRHLIDWNRTDAEYWCWNEVGSLRDDKPDYWAKRVDLLLQMHATPIWRNKGNRNHKGHYAWLQQAQPYPVYMQDVYPDVPASVKYPKAEIVAKLLPNLRRDIGDGRQTQVEHFTSSACYAFALALYQGKTEVHMHGIEAKSETEYARQRDGITFWLGIAVGRGVDVTIHSPWFMNEKLYGYTGEVVIQRQEFELTSALLEKEVKKAEIEAAQRTGRSRALLELFIKTKDKKSLDEFIKALDQSQDALFNYGALLGKQDENKRYIVECDELIAAAGGEKALEAIMQGEVVTV